MMRVSIIKRRATEGGLNKKKDKINKLIKATIRVFVIKRAAAGGLNEKSLACNGSERSLSKLLLRKIDH